MVAFVVYGIPAPKGSKRAFPIHRGKGRGRRFTGKVAMVESAGERLKDWARAINDVVQGLAESGTPKFEGPLELTVRFFLPKPKSAPKRRQTWPVKKPDLDKLLRALCDPLTGVLIHDDAQFIELHASKHYADDDVSDRRARAEVTIHPLHQEQDVLPMGGAT